MLSLICTVYNEGESIQHLLDSLARQTCPADEIVIVDGGSTDNTVNILEQYEQKLPLTIISEPGANISRGRNVAFASTHGDIIAITDAGVRLPNDWLEHITVPFRRKNPPEVVAGFFRADPHTVFEAAMGATVLPLQYEIDPAHFLPSSRSIAVRRSAFEQVGGYPEWLDYCEDLIFDLRLKANAQFTFAPDACVAFRPRGSIREFFKQYYLYARGDGKADLWRKRHAIRYVTYLVVIPSIALLGVMWHPMWLLLFVIGGAIYLRQPFQRLPYVLRQYHYQHPLNPLQMIYAVVLIPVIRVVGDIAKMIGYPVGWRWRLQYHPPDWRL